MTHKYVVAYFDSHEGVLIQELVEASSETEACGKVLEVSKKYMHDQEYIDAVCEGGDVWITALKI